MNIKKIIKEEVNSFDWTEDIHPFTLDEDWVIEFESEQEYIDIQEWLFSKGVYWDGHEDDEDRDVSWSSDGNFGFFFNSGIGFDSYSYDRRDEYSSMLERMEEDYPHHDRTVWRYLSSTLNESNGFDWVEDHEVTYKVHELEVGKTYQFVPDLTLLDHPGVDKAPEWVYDYGTSKFYIIKQEPSGRYSIDFTDSNTPDGYITFKPIGKAERMVYDGKYTRLPYQARVFMWGKFKEVDNPIMESEFDWTDDIDSGLIDYGSEWF
jgi:hypothetical protein